MIDWRELLKHAYYVPPHLSLGYVSDLRWMLWHWLMQHWRQLGWTIAYNDVLCSPYSMARRDAVAAIRGEAFISRAGWHIDLEFASRYGCTDYSFHSINGGDVHHWSVVPEDFWGAEPLSLGNIAVVMGVPPQGRIAKMPEGWRAVGQMEFWSGKRHSIQLCAGVRFTPESAPNWIHDSAFAARSKPLDAGYLRSIYDSPFMQQFRYLDPGASEVELRERLGYPPPGKIGVREEILYRSVKRVLTEEWVIRRYRGRELRGLELDIWVPRLRLGFEYQGEQHFREVRHWHGGDGFHLQRERDRIKKKICKELGYTVLYFLPHEDVGEQAVLERLRALGILVPWYAPMAPDH